MQGAAAALDDGWDDGRVRRIPVPWPELQRVVQPLGGQQVVIVAAPSVGKSTLALNWAAKSGARTLFMSADTDQRTMTESVAALATGHPRDLIRDRLGSSRTWRLQYAEAIETQFPNLVMDFTGGPSIKAVAERAEALTEVWGETPHIVVADTATDVQRQGEDYAAWRKNWIAWRSFSRYFNCSVFLPHHVKSGPARNGNVEPEQDSAKYGADEFAEIVLGLWRPEADNSTKVTVTVLKNRTGRRMVRIPFAADFQTGRVAPVPDNHETERGSSDSVAVLL